MTTDRKSRREFLRQMACLAASGGAAALIPQLRMMGTALAQTTPSSLSGYRALVCIYLSGGNDAWNLLVPKDSTNAGSLWDIYRTSRSGVYNATSNPGGLAIDFPQLLGLTGATGSGSNMYGLHPSCPELRTLYDAQKLGLVVNVGPLVKPITKAEYASSLANRPPQLFSHSDQENLWHVGTAKDSRYGWAGSAINTLKSQFPPGGNAVLSPCISVAGSNKLEVGSSVFPYFMSSSSSNTTPPLSGVSGVCNGGTCSGTFGAQRDGAVTQLLAATYQGGFANEYAQTFQRGRDLYQTLFDGLNSAPGQLTTTTFPANNSLGDQLRSVARMIKLSRANNYAARQIYYVRTGGFDLHSGLMATGTNGHAGLLSRLSQALNAFNAALGEIGAQNDVTAFTMSEFARTLTSNGNGSDHAWGSVQLVMGGGVQGGKLYSSGGGPISGFPDQSITLDSHGNNTNPVAFSRGQFIPGIGVDQYAATLAKWLGVTATTDQDAIFPNLANFATRDLGFMG
ncbi:DUF1501 domain-containing protein [Dokdonella soli]|uniref:DUF1501 domain-containing protein n=1 Tax=Dokdonella soli TaxID=529810 RepID=A0ABP3TKV6_9GAMM